MAEVLLLNPAKRRKARRRNPSPAQRAARAKFAAMARARRRNPAHPAVAYAANPRRRRRYARRRNPAMPLAAYRRVARARRRNPIGGINLIGIMSMAKNAAIQGAGAVAVDMAFGYINPLLPANLRDTGTGLTAGTAIKVLITGALGQLLDRPTRGLARKAAEGALTVQAHRIVGQLLPQLGLSGRLGYATPASRVVSYSPRVAPGVTNMGMYVPGGRPLLNGVGAYTRPGVAPMMLNGARAREGAIR